MAQYANPQQFGAPMGEDGQYMQQVKQKFECYTDIEYFEVWQILFSN